MRSIKKDIEYAILNSDYWKKGNTTVGDVSLISDDVISWLQVSGHIDRPFLGLATTQEMLEELKARAEPDSPLHDAASILLQDLPLTTLQYRTVQS